MTSNTIDNLRLEPGVSSKKDRTNLMLYLATILIWGSTWFPIKLQVDYVKPEISVIYRLLIASVLLFGWCWLRKLPLRYTVKDHFFMALFGLLLFGINLTLLYAGSAYITSGLEAIVFSTIVIMNMANGFVFLKRKPDLKVVIGALIGLVGLCMIFWNEVISFDIKTSASVGLLICLAATLCASLGNIISVRNQKAGISVVHANAFGMAYAAVFLIIYVLIRHEPFTFSFTFTYIASLFYLALFGSVFAYGFYLSLLTRVGPERAAYANLIFPVVALLISTVFEQYQWTSRVAMGIGMIFLGNAFILIKKSAVSKR
jgi:drug/metabolite transporter (DMT)-like permease